MRLWSPAVFGTANLVDGCITNAKVNATAGIVSTKLDLTAIAQDCAPATDNDYPLGDATHRFTQISVNKIEGGAVGQILLAGIIGGS